MSAGIVIGDPEGGWTAGPRRDTANPRAHHELLTPAVVECLAEAGLEPGDLDAVVVGEGPGPFTGLRVGMATAQAFADALDIAVWGVATLDAMAWQVAPDVGQSELVVVTDARRREVYTGRYTVHGGVPTRQGDLQVCAPQSVELAGVTHCTGEVELLGELPEVAVMPCRFPSPLALVQAVAWEAGPQPLVARYLRRPDAVAAAAKPLSPALRGGPRG